MNTEKPSESFLLQCLMDHFPDYIYFKDTESRFFLINKALSDHYGLKDPSSVVGKTDQAFYRQSFYDQFIKEEQKILKTGKPILNLEEKAISAQGEETWHSTSKIPLVDELGNIVGTFGVSRDITEKHRFDEQVREMAESLRKKNAEYEADLSIAIELQNALIPKQYPCFPLGATESESRVQFDHRYLPSQKVGGDFFDLIRISDEELGILFGDVVGHGVQSALVMAMIRSLATSGIQYAREPLAFLDYLNRNLMMVLKQSDRCLYATATYGVLNLETGKLTIENAGQAAPLWIRNQDQQLEFLSWKSIRGPIGLFDSKPAAPTEINLRPGDRILFFTDGLYEVANAKGEILGEQRLREIAIAHASKATPAMLDSLIEISKAFSPIGTFDDDVCLLGVEFRG